MSGIGRSTTFVPEIIAGNATAPSKVYGDPYAFEAASAAVTEPRMRQNAADPAAAPFDTVDDVRVAAVGGTIRVFRSGKRGGTVTLWLHGGGLSALSFGLLAAEFQRRGSETEVVAPDLRGHGGTRIPDEKNIAVSTMAGDIVALLEELFGEVPPPIVLVGHSMGGALATHLAASGLLPTLIGVAAIDVVEGTAVAALPMMQDYLKSRPSHFASPSKAIDWAVTSGLVRNRASAAVSLPSQLVPENDSVGLVGVKAGTEVWKWRTALEETEPHWSGWFEDLSKKFLAAPCPKLLILAAITTLDVDLMVAQMQGKFMLAVVDDVGHMVHEDSPAKVADILTKFIARQAIGCKDF